MPIPKPKKGEKEDDFIERCMGNETMKDEYPDNDQRLAICYDSWRKEKGGEKPKTKEEAHPDIEYRAFAVEEFRLIKEDGGPTKIVGHAAVFNKESEPISFFGQTFIEKIAPGAFKKAIKNSDPRSLFNHDPSIVLGRKSAGTLKLKEDEKGLYSETTPPDTQYVKDVVLTPIERGDVKEMSFGFTVKSEEWKEDKDKQIVTRTLLEVDKLFDVSPVTFPAYPDTTVAVRSYEQWRKETQDSQPGPSEVTPEDSWKEITSADADQAEADLRELRTRLKRIEVSKL
jgi:HK97 family phage prohead protease